MDDHTACQTPAHEIAEGRRRCWAGDCQRTARLEWCGWRYCLPHYWSHALRDAGPWPFWWIKLKYTRLARR